MKFNLQLLALLLLTGPASASDYQQFKDTKGLPFSVRVPSGWYVLDNLFGIPVSLVAPKSVRGEIKNRPIIGITPGALPPFKLTPETLGTKNGEYEASRRYWLEQKHDGKALRFFPYRQESWKHIDKVHVFGIRYELYEKIFVETTYYFECGPRFFNIKTLVRDELFRKLASTMKKTVESFKCR